jgi:predicted peptidase
MKARFIVSLSLLVVCTLAASNSYSQTASVSQAGQHPHRLKKYATKIVAGQYLLFLPRDYGKSRKQYPLIMYLHGGSLRGDSVEKVRTLGLPQMVEQDKSFPFIVVSPLCPAGEIWTDTDLLIGILDEVLTKYSVDRSRVYLTGHSMGGRGAWYLAYKHPERFAAVAPMSGGPTITAWASRLKDVPVWAFHGAKDDIVPLIESEELVKAIKAAGGDIKLTVLPDRDHFILDIYENKQLYDWFLQHKRNR